ncbi:MAG: hypothetical protein JXR95_08290 [Deltaproteobacteria bacterium]|nr:hypothetical protein [Deltaproteobacteria bacterium]
MKKIFLLFVFFTLNLYSTVSHGQKLWSNSLGARGLATGDGLIATPTGSDAIASNPAGMSLIKSYIWENYYMYNSSTNTHTAQTAFVDSFLNPRLAAGAYYIHQYGEREFYSQGTEVTRKENLMKGGLAISVKFTDFLVIGVNGYYYDWEYGDAAEDGISMDTGMVIAVGQNFFVGVTGYDLIGDHNDNNPWTMGTGAALKLLQGRLIFEIDLVAEEKELWYRGGGEFFFSQGIAIRGGGGYRERTEEKYFTLGLGYITKKSSIEMGVRKDIAGSDAVYFGIDIRLFIR